MAAAGAGVGAGAGCGARCGVSAAVTESAASVLKAGALPPRMVVVLLLLLPSWLRELGPGQCRGRKGGGCSGWAMQAASLMLFLMQTYSISGEAVACSWRVTNVCNHLGTSSGKVFCFCRSLHSAVKRHPHTSTFYYSPNTVGSVVDCRWRTFPTNV